MNHDSIARDDLARNFQNAGIWPPGAPTFVINSRVLVGFDSAERTGPLLAAVAEQVWYIRSTLK